jgi:hypothetical protein
MVSQIVENVQQTSYAMIGGIDVVVRRVLALPGAALATVRRTLQNLLGGRGDRAAEHRAANGRRRTRGAAARRTKRS